MNSILVRVRRYFADKPRCPKLTAKAAAIIIELLSSTKPLALTNWEMIYKPDPDERAPLRKIILKEVRKIT